MLSHSFFIFFFFNDPATTEIYTLSLHDALPILLSTSFVYFTGDAVTYPSAIYTVEGQKVPYYGQRNGNRFPRSEEHTSELQSRPHLVCRLLLEKKKNKKQKTIHHKKTPYQFNTK